MKKILTFLSISCAFIFVFGQPVKELTPFQRENQAYHLPGSFTLNTTAAWHLAEDSKDKPLEIFAIDNGLYDKHPNIPYEKGNKIFEISQDNPNDLLELEIEYENISNIDFPELDNGDEYIFYHGDSSLEHLFGNHSLHVFAGVLPEANTTFSLCKNDMYPLKYNSAFTFSLNTGCFQVLSVPDIENFIDIILLFSSITYKPNVTSDEEKRELENLLESTSNTVLYLIKEKKLLFVVPEKSAACLNKKKSESFKEIYDGIDSHFFRIGRTNNNGTPYDDYSAEKEIDFLSTSNSARTKGIDSNGNYEYTNPGNTTECPSVTLAAGVAGMLLREAKRSGKFTSSDIKGIMKTTASKWDVYNEADSENVTKHDFPSYTTKNFETNRTPAVGHGNLNAHQALLLMKALAGQEEHIYVSEAVDASTPIEFSFNKVLFSEEKQYATAINGYSEVNTYKLPAKNADGQINFQANNGNDGYNFRSIQIKRASNTGLTDKDMLSKIVVTPNSEKIEFYDYSGNETPINEIKIPSLVSLLEGKSLEEKK